MAVFVSTDAYVSINSVDLSAYVKSVTLNATVDLKEKQAMGDTSKKRLPGLKDWSLDIDFLDDEASSAVMQTLFPLLGAASVAILVRPVKATVVGSTNPNYSGNAILGSLGAVSYQHGEIPMTKATFSGDGTLSRATS